MGIPVATGRAEGLLSLFLPSACLGQMRMRSGLGTLLESLPTTGLVKGMHRVENDAAVKMMTEVNVDLERCSQHIVERKANYKIVGAVRACFGKMYLYVQKNLALFISMWQNYG